MIILLHSSKTMRAAGSRPAPLQPALLEQSQKIDAYLKTLSETQLVKTMHLSKSLATKTHQLIAEWSADPARQSLAIDCFSGDIYRGLRPSSLTQDERDYADKHLYILSGLYGCLRPYDGIMPYRLEMMYKLPKLTFNNLYKFWGKSVADCLPDDEPIINVSSVEYSKLVTPYINPERIVSPEFLTLHSQKGENTFVAVHAKVARGAFARWMIQNRIETVKALQGFNELGYKYEAKLSTLNKPTYVCKEFGGLGLTV